MFVRGDKNNSVKKSQQFQLKNEILRVVYIFKVILNKLIYISKFKIIFHLILILFLWFLLDILPKDPETCPGKILVQSFFPQETTKKKQKKAFFLGRLHNPKKKQKNVSLKRLLRFNESNFFQDAFAAGFRDQT